MNGKRIENFKADRVERKSGKVWTFIIFGACILLFVCCKFSGNFTSQVKHFELLGNTSTGYIWKVSLSDSGIIDIEEKTSFLGNSENSDALSLFFYKIKSIKPGSLCVLFEYKQPWETQPADHKLLYQVTVLKNGKIKMNEIKR